MADSIKQRLGGSHIGKMNDKELRKLLNAALVDLTALRSVVNNMAADANNVQVVLNNMRATVVNLQVGVNQVIADAVKLNANLNSPNSTVTLTAVAVVNSLASNPTLAGGTSAPALTLVS